MRILTLPMTDAAIRDEDLACLSPLAELKQLEFGRVKGYTDAGLKHLSGLAQLKKLVFFDNSQITDAGMKHLASLKKLEELGLVATSVSDNGLREFIGCTLLRLNVGGRPAADNMMPVIAEFRDLLELGLHGNVITDNNMLGLQSLTKLQHLGLMGASVTDEGLKTVATLKVQDLHLQGPKFTDGGLKNLEKMISLTKLSIKDTKITASGIDALKKALPGCKIGWDDPSKLKTAAPARN